ncbi:hypothetical protein [Algibacter pacificus]|uniref:hypothetical protein n=1 Tax=Algibacter pacificus TaxID=2599389 RepID=UPI0011CBC1BA|nr:hypothetical protein [Algibacter pacificus]
MKFYFSFFIFLLFTISSFAQIDSRNNKSTPFPVIESEKDSLKAEIPKPSTPIEAKSNPLNGMNAPRVSTDLSTPKRQISMFPEEEFGNPGELYTKNLDRQKTAVLPDGYGENAGLKKDAFWGDYHTKSLYVQIKYRDYSAVDGDLLRIFVNDDVLRSNVHLGRGFSGFRLKLKEGANKIEFFAINTGASGPNTAEYRIEDETGAVIANKVWALEKGVRVSVVVIKD